MNGVHLHLETLLHAETLSNGVSYDTAGAPMTNAGGVSATIGYMSIPMVAPKHGSAMALISRAGSCRCLAARFGYGSLRLGSAPKECRHIIRLL